MSLRLVPVDYGKPIKLDKPVVLVGRNPDCDAILTDSCKVSRVHCLLACVGKKVYVRDLGSTNGVWVNGHRVEREARMRVGDEITFADLKYELVTGDDVPEPPAKKKRAPEPPDESKEHILKAPAFDERETRDPLPKRKTPVVSKDKLVAIPDQSDSFVVEPSIMRPARPVNSDDELPLPDLDLDEVSLSGLLEDDDEPPPLPAKKKSSKAAPPDDDVVLELNEDDLLPPKRQKKAKRDDSDDSPPIIRLELSDG